MSIIIIDLSTTSQIHCILP